MAAHVFISRTWGPKTGKTLWVWGYLGLHSEFQDIQGYLERSCLKYLLLLWKFHILKVFNPLNTIPYQTLNPSVLSHPTLWLVLFTFCHQFQCVFLLVLVRLSGIISLKGNRLSLTSNHQMLKPPQLVLAFHVCLLLFVPKFCLTEVCPGFMQAVTTSLGSYVHLPYWVFKTLFFLKLSTIYGTYNLFIPYFTKIPKSWSEI